MSALCSLILYNGISTCRAGSTFTVEGCSRSSIKPQTPDLLTRLTRLLRDAAIEQHLAKEEIELAFARQRESKAVMQLNGLRSVVKDLVKDARQAEQGDIGAVGGEGVVRGQGVPAWQQLEVLKPVQLEKVEQKLREAKTQPRLVWNLTLREVWLGCERTLSRTAENMLVAFLCRIAYGNMIGWKKFLDWEEEVSARR